MEIVVDVIHQKMHASITKDIAAGSQRFVKFKFNLDKEWNGLKIFAQFRQGNAAYNDFLDDENCVYLPQEIQAGCCYLMLYGSNESTIGTVCPLALTINDNKLISNAESIEITESLYNQLITEFMRLERQVSDFTNNDDIVNRINKAVEKEVDEFNFEVTNDGNLMFANGDKLLKNVGYVKGDKGDKGDKGENGTDYILTEADKTDIAAIVISNFTDVSEVGQ